MAMGPVIALRPASLWRGGGWVLLAAAIGFASPSHAAVGDRVKAAFLLNFAKFVDWPAGHFDAPDSPVQLCLQVPDDVADTIRSSLAGKSVGRRPMRVERRPESLDGCDLAYLRGDDHRVRQQLGRLPSPGLLSVYEHPDTVESGVIRLFLEERKIRFSIDVESAQAQQLTVSAKLLSVARQP